MGSAEVAAERDRLASQALFHAWLAVAHGRASSAAAQDAARARPDALSASSATSRIELPARRGRRLGLAGDVCVTRVQRRAPHADGFRQRRQGSTEPPWHPQRLRRPGMHAALAGLVHARPAARRRAPGVDHVIGPVPGCRQVPGRTRTRPGLLRAAGTSRHGRGPSATGHLGRALAMGRGSRHRGTMLDTGAAGRPGGPRARAMSTGSSMTGPGCPAPAGQVAAQLPGHGGHARHPADRGVRDRGAGGAAFPARPADPLLPGRKRRVRRRGPRLAGRPGGRGPAPGGRPGPARPSSRWPATPSWPAPRAC